MPSEEELKILSEIEQETRAQDPVSRNFKYRAFTSRSKGIRNGKQRIRRNWKDIELISYRDNGFHQWHRFPFDETATEALPGWEEWKAKEHIQETLRSKIND